MVRCGRHFHGRNGAPARDAGGRGIGIENHDNPDDFYGPNAGYAVELYERYMRDPRWSMRRRALSSASRR
jgi:hypothetical protein